MPKYVIEREMPRVGQLTVAALQAASQNSCAILAEMGAQIQWLQSYITDNKIYGIYIAENEEQLRQHAYQTGLPAHKITAVNTIIDPTTAEK